MSVRRAVRAGSFYPASESACRRAVLECTSQIADSSQDSGSSRVDHSAAPPRLFLGGLVPHAGWTYSGPTAGLTFLAVGDPPPRCFVLFGAVHRPGVQCPSVTRDRAWSTPIGDVPVDREVAELILSEGGDLVREDSVAHAGEHSIEVQIPFVRALFPDAAIVPVAVTPTPAAVELGRAVGSALRAFPDRVVVIGSTDLTHYGPAYGFSPHGVGGDAHRWAKEVNDLTFLDPALARDPVGVLTGARANRSACGGGAAAATVSACNAMGAESAELLAHVTSHEVRAEETDPRDFVGYASVAFFRERGA